MCSVSQKSRTNVCCSEDRIMLSVFVTVWTSHHLCQSCIIVSFVNFISMHCVTAFCNLVVRLLHQELISYHFSSCSCRGNIFKKRLSPRHFKSDWDEIWQECSRLIRIDWWSRIFDLLSHFQDGIIVHRKVLPPGEWMQSAWRLCSSVHQFLICSTFVLVMSYTAVHGWRSGLPCCCCPYLEQSIPTCHVRAFYVCFSKSPQGFSLQAFFPMTFTATVLVPVLWQLSFSGT